MKLITLTLLILASTAFSASVENLNDAIENVNQLVSEKIDYLLLARLTPDQESIELAAEFKDSIPKLQKIQRGLTRDGFEKVAKGLDNTISFARQASDPQYVSDYKPQCIMVIEAIRKLFRAAKRYLDDEDLFVSISFKESSLKDSLENLNLAISEEYVVSFHLDQLNVDQESIDIAKAFKIALPKLKKIEKGLRKDNRIDDAEELHQGIKVVETFTDAELVFNQKERAKKILIRVNDVIKLGKKYLDDDELFVLISANEIKDDKKTKLEELREKLKDLEKRLREKGYEHRAYIVRHYINALEGLLKKLENGDLNDERFNDFVTKVKSMLEKYEREM